MANKINEKLGLNPQTRTRQATHSPTIAPTLRCPKCGGNRVHRRIDGRLQDLGTHWCIVCAVFFSPGSVREQEIAVAAKYGG